MSPTIKDIAKELGVSYSSVSRALNGKKGVSEKTRIDIENVAKALGYQPNDLARGLVNKVSKTIGVIIPEITNPFFSEIVKGIIEASTKENYDIFLCVSNWDADIEASYLQALRKKQVDGVIIKPARDQDVSIYEQFVLPHVILESWEKLNNACSISLDNEKGGYIATKHLIKCGYKNIGFLPGKRESLSSKQRKIGWQRALYEAGMADNENRIVYTNFSIEGGYEATKTLMETDESIDAIFAANDVIALGALQYLSENNIAVPDRIGVIGFDNISYSRLPQIMLTTVNQPVYDMGTIAFKSMVEMLQGKEDSKGKSIVLEPDLIIRRTTRGEIDGEN